MRFSKKELTENHERMLERNEFYRRNGYDADKNGAYVLSKAILLRGRILEIGTGKGRFLTALLRHTPRVTTVDVDPGEQLFARMNVAYEKPRGKARFVIADAAHLPWRAHSFDMVVSMNALHHMKRISIVIKEILRVVRPTGMIILADFNERGFTIFDQIHRREHRTHQREHYDFKAIAKKLADCHWSSRLYSAGCQNVLTAKRCAVGAPTSN